MFIKPLRLLVSSSTSVLISRIYKYNYLSLTITLAITSTLGRLKSSYLTLSERVREVEIKLIKSNSYLDSSSTSTVR